MQKASEGMMGNIAYISKNGDTYTYSYDTEWSDLLISVRDQNNTLIKSYTYDEIGNPLSDGTYNYSWRFGRQLHTVTDGDTQVARYIYNVDGVRTEKRTEDGTTLYALDGDQIIGEVRGNGDTLHYIYGQSGVEYLVHNNTNVYWVMKNLQGDVIGLAKVNSDGSATVVCHYTYTAFGELLSVVDAYGETITDHTHIALVNPLRYRVATTMTTRRDFIT